MKLRTVPPSISGVRRLATPSSSNGRDAGRIAEALQRAGVLTIATGPDTLRFVTHYDVGDDEVDRAIEAFGAALS